MIVGSIQFEISEGVTVTATMDESSVWQCGDRGSEELLNWLFGKSMAGAGDPVLPAGHLQVMQAADYFEGTYELPDVEESDDSMPDDAVF